MSKENYTLEQRRAIIPLFLNKPLPDLPDSRREAEDIDDELKIEVLVELMVRIMELEKSKEDTWKTFANKSN